MNLYEEGRKVIIHSGVEKSQRDIMLRRQQVSGLEWMWGEDSDLELRRRAGNDVEWRGWQRPIVDSRGADTVFYRSEVGEEAKIKSGQKSRAVIQNGKRLLQKYDSAVKKG